MNHSTLIGVAKNASEGPYSIPFIGRGEELNAITAFCRDIREGDELGACWIQGEAGIGKSALLRQIERRLKGKENILLSLCLYPDSVESVISLLANTLEVNPAVTPLLVERVTPALPSVLAALRRLSRLRPLILILEDLHLMGDESCSELYSLLHGLRNESVTVLCVSCIANGETYLRLLPFIRKSIDIPPLTRAEVEELTDTTLLRSLHIDGGTLYKASRGYPLILQGLIAELHNVSVADRDLEKSGRRMLSLLTSKAALSIKGLTDAFLIGLTNEERDQTRRLAILGELFSLETANHLLRNTPGLIDRLIQKGVIVRANTFSLPLYGTYDSTIPFRFNHSLLFEELLRDAHIEEDVIVDVIESRLPLYSLTFFGQVEKALPGSVGPERMEEAIRIMLKEATGRELALAFDQKVAGILCEEAERLYRRHREEFASERARLLELELNAAALQAVRFQVFTQWHLDRLEHFTRLTEEPESEQVALYRSLCLSNRLHHYQNSIDNIDAILSEAERLVERFPALSGTREFIYLVAYMATRCGGLEDSTALDRVRALCDQIFATADPAAQVSGLSFVGTQIFHALSTTSESQEELDRAIAFGHALRERLAPYCSERDAIVMDSICTLMFINSGCLHEAVKIFHHYRATILHSRDIAVQYFKRTIIGMQAALGVPIPELEEGYRRFLEELQGVVGSTGEESPKALPRSQWILAIEVLTQGYLRGDVRWAERFALQIVRGNVDGLRSIMPVNRVASLGDREALRSFVDHPRFGPLVRAAVGEVESVEDAIATARTFLAKGVIGTPTLLELQTILDLIQLACVDDAIQTAMHRLDDEIAAAIRQGVKWCVQKGMPGYAEPLLRFGVSYLSAKEHAGLAGKVERRIKQMPDEVGLHEFVRKQERDDCVALSVVGTISTSHPAGPEQRFQGGRVRRTAALIVANQLLQRPLSLSEFRYIATGMDPHSEKTAGYSRTLLWRIRSVLGPNSIIADGETPPRFDPLHVRVDLLEAAALLDRCALAVREARPRQAREALKEALNIVGEGPIYPTLFDEFFEAARLDFELRLRDMVRSTVMLLRREGDLQEAEHILRTALYSMSGDEELIEEMAEILELLGRNAEAVAARGMRRET